MTTHKFDEVSIVTSDENLEKELYTVNIDDLESLKEDLDHIDDFEKDFYDEQIVVYGFTENDVKKLQKCDNTRLSKVQCKNYEELDKYINFITDNSRYDYDINNYSRKT